MSEPTITLCMIVKDESHIIRECLESVSTYIDRYDITDTGSTDGTQQIIKDFFEEKGIPGTVHQSDWKGFGKSRTESLDNAKENGADYALIIDADDYLTGELPKPNVNDPVDGYVLRITRGEFTWWRTQLMKLSSDWHYVGILHEYAGTRDKPHPTTKRLEGNYTINARTEGSRNIGVTPVEKYKKDAELLLSALTNEEDPNYEPDNHRYLFYLAQSYFDCQEWEDAQNWYQKRADAGGWPEEVFYSLLQPAVGYIFAKRAAEIPYPSRDILFITDEVYSWQSLDELVTCAHSVGDIHVGYSAAKKLLDENLLPEEHVERVTANFNVYKTLVEQHQSKIVAEHQKRAMDAEEEKQRIKEEKRTKVKKPTKQKSRRHKMNK